LVRITFEEQDLIVQDVLDVIEVVTAALPPLAGLQGLLVALFHLQDVRALVLEVVRVVEVRRGQLSRLAFLQRTQGGGEDWVLFDKLLLEARLEVLDVGDD